MNSRGSDTFSNLIRFNVAVTPNFSSRRVPEDRNGFVKASTA